MKKSRFSRSSKRRRTGIIKNIGRTTKRVLPIFKTGLSKIGQNVKVAATKSEPAIKQGFKSIYGTLATGFKTGLNKLSTLSTFKKSSAKRRAKRRVNRRTKRRGRK